MEVVAPKDVDVPTNALKTPKKPPKNALKTPSKCSHLLWPYFTVTDQY